MKLEVRLNSVLSEVAGYGTPRIVFKALERTLGLRKIGCDMLSFPGDLPVKLNVGMRRGTKKVNIQ